MELWPAQSLSDIPGGGLCSRTTGRGGCLPRSARWQWLWLSAWASFRGGEACPTFKAGRWAAGSQVRGGGFLGWANGEEDCSHLQYEEVYIKALISVCHPVPATSVGSRACVARCPPQAHPRLLSVWEEPSLPDRGQEGLDWHCSSDQLLENPTAPPPLAMYLFWRLSGAP